MHENNSWVLELLKDKGLALIGFADLSEIDAEARRGFPYGVSVAMALKVFPSATAEPSRAYYDEYRRVSAELRAASDFLVGRIEARGFRAYSLYNYKQGETYKVPLPFKTLATRAGLGWIGKSAVLVTREYGCAVRLSGVLTDMPLLSGTPVNASYCGDCDECVKFCPGKAISGSDWRLGVDRDALLDASACKRAVVERGKALGVTDGSCGICIAVCPWTRQFAMRNA